MSSLTHALIAGVSSLGVALAAFPAEAASSNSSRTVAGIDMKDIQTVGRNGGGGRGWGGGGRGWGGGRHFGGGGRGWGGGRHWGGRGWNGGGPRYGYRGGYGRGYGWRGGYGRYGYGPRYGYYRYGHRGYGYGGGYYAAGLFGLAAGAALASPYYYDDYYDRPYYRTYRYSGAECQVITKRRTGDGRLVRVVRYRPC